MYCILLNCKIQSIQMYCIVLNFTVQFIHTNVLYNTALSSTTLCRAVHFSEVVYSYDLSPYN